MEFHKVPFLGAIFYTIYQRFAMHFTSQIHLYADETTAMASADYRSIVQLEETLNTSVAEIQHWAEANKRPLNDEKTKVLMVTSKRLASRLDEQHTIVINGDTQLTHNVVTTLLERCSLVRSDLTFRRRSHDVHRSFGLSQRCHNVV